MLAASPDDIGTGSKASKGGGMLGSEIALEQRGNQLQRRV